MYQSLNGDIFVVPRDPLCFGIEGLFLNTADLPTAAAGRSSQATPARHRGQIKMRDDPDERISR